MQTASLNRQTDIERTNNKENIREASG